MSGWSSDAKIHIFFILTPTNENKKALLVTMPQSKAPYQLPKAPHQLPRGGERADASSKFKRRSIVYTPLLLYSYTPNERLLSKLLNSQTSNNYCLHSHTPKLPTLLKRMFQGNHTCYFSLLTSHLKKLLTFPSSYITLFSQATNRVVTRGIRLATCRFAT